MHLIGFKFSCWFQLNYCFSLQAGKPRPKNKQQQNQTGKPRPKNKQQQKQAISDMVTMDFSNPAIFRVRVNGKIEKDLKVFYGETIKPLCLIKYIELERNSPLLQKFPH